MSRLTTAYAQLGALQSAPGFVASKDQLGRRPQGLADLPLQVNALSVLGDLQRHVLGAFMPGFNAANAGIAGLGERITTTFTDTRAEARSSFESMARMAADLARNRLGTLSAGAISALGGGSRRMFDLLRSYQEGQVDRWQFRDQGKRLTDWLASRLAGYQELAPLANVLRAWRGIAAGSYREGYRPGDQARPGGKDRTPEEEQRERENLEKSRRYGNPLTAILRASRGADFIVPPGYPNDSYPLLVESGERVQVTPRGQGGGDTYELHIHTSAPVTQETVVSGFYMAKALAGARA